MTLVSDIIKYAYRESNLIALASAVTSNQSSEALALLNSLVLSTVGNEAGDDYVDLVVGGSYDQSDLIGDWIPDNTRLLLNLTGTKRYYLDPYPFDGQRFAVVDVDTNLATYNITIDGNGRNVENAATLVLNTNGLNRQWMYRRDTGNWVKITSLTTGDQLPFPSEFDDYFITMLALRLNPRYGQELQGASLEALRRSRRQLRAKYNPPRPIDPDFDSRGLMAESNNTYGSDFDRGRTYPWR